MSKRSDSQRSDKSQGGPHEGGYRKKALVNGRQAQRCVRCTRLLTFFCAFFFPFFCPVHPTLPQAIFFPKIPSFWDLFLIFLVEKRQPAGAGFWGRFWTGSPHRKKGKSFFFWRARKGECLGFSRRVRPNTVSGSTVSNTELSEFFCPHRVPGRELSEFLSAYFLCDTEFFAELTEFAPKLSEAQ